MKDVQTQINRLLAERGDNADEAITGAFKVIRKLVALNQTLVGALEEHDRRITALEERWDSDEDH